MSHEDVELDNRELLERGNDMGIPFEEGWKKCHTQGCAFLSGTDSNGNRVYRCKTDEEGCPTADDVWCCCELFHCDTSVDPDDRRWERVPPDAFDERGWHEAEEGYLHECFCVRRDPWSPDEMPCPHPDEKDEEGETTDERAAFRFDLQVDLAFELRGRTVSVSESFRLRV